jgi:6-methylsalicylate decarboxylase
MSKKFDVHSHALPAFFHDRLLALGSEAAGIPVITWSMEATRRMTAKEGIATSILSLSTPGPQIASDTQGQRGIARQYNEWAYNETRQNPAQLGFFAAVPDLHDHDGCLAEIAYALDTLAADGICIYTTYQGKYLGEPMFRPIWQMLHSRRAIVFIHPSPPVGFKLVDRMLALPAFDFPHETGRTAAHLIMTGTKRLCPDAQIILAHGGGTLPWLSERLAILQEHMFSHELLADSPKTAEHVLQDAKSFYFDTALCGTANVLDSLLKWAPQSHILYGSDFPYAVVEAEYNNLKLEQYDMTKDLRDSIYIRNALRLFPRFQRKT